ncbi:MAG: trypsin-like serine protease [Myxococcota bacterium]
MKLRTLFILTQLSQAMACGGTAPAPALDDSSDEIIGGRRDARHRAVGQLGTSDEGWFCTAALIAPDVALTAAHCVFDLDGARVPASSLIFGLDEEVLEVASVSLNHYAPGTSAWNDLAVLALRDASSVSPMPIAHSAPETGARLTVVGYGVTRATGAHTGTGGGTRRSTTVVLGELRTRELAYSSELRGACYGDSGGPILARLGGREVIVGVTSRGTAVDCAGLDIATRVDAYASWITRQL